MFNIIMTLFIGTSIGFLMGALMANSSRLNREAEIRVELIKKIRQEFEGKK